MTPFVERHDRRRIPRSPRRVLVIDDEPNILFALQEAVVSEGYECLPAENGEEGLFMAQAVLPDLVISDVIMPKIDGFELCRSLKAGDRTRHIPVILVTVRSLAKEIDEGTHAGADAYHVKPFRVHELLDRMQAFLGPVENPDMTGSTPIGEKVTAALPPAL